MKHPALRWLLAAGLAILVLPVFGYAFFKDTPLFTDEPESASERVSSQSPESASASPGRNANSRTGPEVPANRASVGRTPRKDVAGGDSARSPEKTDAQLPAPGKSCGDPLVIVDKKNALPSYYEPRDLVSLDEYGIPNKGKSYLRRETAEHLQDMVSEARSLDIELMVDSAYRSYLQQKWTFANYSFVHGSRRADVVSARPGHSQHQLGTTVDFTNAAVGYQLVPAFESTVASLWLKKHAAEYGFVLPYTDRAEVETGVQSEPWHYRYIGVGNAKRLQKSDLSLNSFLEREGITPRC